MAGEGAERSVTVRAVFDCMVFLQGAARETGPAAACLCLVQEGFVRLFLTDDILAEIADVLTRPKVRRQFPVLTSEYVESFLNGLRAVAEVVADVPAVVTLERDPKDEKYINAALFVSAQYLVSRDNDLLDLMKELTANGGSFPERFPGLVIIDPVAFLDVVRAEIERANGKEHNGHGRPNAGQ